MIGRLYIKTNYQFLINNYANGGEKEQKCVGAKPALRCLLQAANTDLI